MSELQKLFQRLHENARYKADLEKAREAFSFRPFAIEYRPIFLASLAGRWLLAIFSVCTGYFALFAPFQSTLPIWLAGVLAGLLLLAVEAAKSLFIGLTFREFYKSGKLPIIGGLALGCLAVSVYLSLTGVKQLYRGLDTSNEQMEAHFTTVKDSIDSHFTAKIEAEKQALAEYRRSVTWAGKIDVSNPTTKAVIAAHTSAIAQLEADRRAALAATAADRATARAELEERTGFNIVFWVCLSAIVEVLIFGCGWFGVYYQFRVYSDGELVENNDHRLHLSINDLQQFAQFITFGRSDMVLPIAKTDENAPKTIGFKPLQKDSPDTPQSMLAPPLNPSLNPVQTGLQGVKNEAELRAFLAKYPEVVKCVKCGISTTQTALGCGVSESTVHNVKRCLRVLNEID